MMKETSFFYHDERDMHTTKCTIQQNVLWLSGKIDAHEGKGRI